MSKTESTTIDTRTLNVMRAAQAAQHLGIAKSTFWRWVYEGRVPRGTNITKRCTVWRREVLDAFLAKHESAAQD